MATLAIDQARRLGRLAAPEAAGARLVGRARLGRRTKRLVQSLAPGDIAIIDHPELDGLWAEGLVASGVVGVVNVARSSSARYPNPGPSVLAEAGVRLVDAPGAELFDRLAEGDEVALEAGRLLRGARVLAEGEVVDRRAAAVALEAGRRGLARSADAFAANTVARLDRERACLLGPIEAPSLATPVSGRPALVVARGRDAPRDLGTARRLLREDDPVLIGVDGGADTLLAEGLHPDLIVGDMDSVSDRGLRAAGELVVHAYGDGRAPGAARLEALGLEYHRFAIPGTSEDAALLLAGELGADRVISAGSPASIVDLLDRGRLGCASTVLVRRRLGPRLVDPRGARLAERPWPPLA